jgi:hypothetical protein
LALIIKNFWIKKGLRSLNLNKKGLYGIFNNKEYELDKVDKDLFIITRDLSEMGSGFEYYIDVVGKVNKNILRKKVSRNDLQEIYKVEMWARYKDEEFYIMGEDDGEVLITTQCSDIAKKLDFKFVEPCVYDKNVRIEDLNEIIEKQKKVYLD